MDPSAKVALLRAAGKTVVSSLEDLQDLLERCKHGEKAPPGGVYMVVPVSLDVSEANAMLHGIEELEASYSVKCTRSAGARAKLDAMWRLDAHLVDMEKQVNLLIDMADGFRVDIQGLEEEEARAKLEIKAARRRKRVLLKLDYDRVLREAKEARLHAVQSMGGSLRHLRSMTQKAHRHFKVSVEVLQELVDFHHEIIHTVAFILSGERSMGWIVESLEDINERVIPDLRGLAVRFEAPGA